MEEKNINEVTAMVENLFNLIKDRDINHFDFFGLGKTSTQKEIEDIYYNFRLEFSEENANLITDPAIKEKFDFLRERGKKAYEVISDYKKRAEYEKNGFRDTPEEKPVEEDPHEIAKNYYKKAKTLYQQQKYDIAASILSKAVALDPKADIFLLLGLCQTNIPMQRRDAEQNLLKAAELEDWNAEPYAGLGMLFLQERLVKRAESYFRKALEIEPDHQLAKKKLHEVAGRPAKDLLGDAQKTLKKVFPSFFGKKKK
jgi:tetratricopeptide (TPR) repeat protein